MIDYIKKNHLSLLIFAALVAVLFIKGSNVFGAVTARTTITNPWTFNEDITLSTANFTSTGGSTTLGTTTAEQLTVGGFTVSSSTSNTSETLAAALLNGGNLLLTPNTGATTYTLPASSTITALIPNAGDRTTVYVRNATTTTNANGTITFAGGLGTILENASSTAITSVITGGKGGYLQFWRSSTSTDIYVTLQATQ